MVSLSRSLNTTSAGATFFEESGTMTDRELLVPDLEVIKTFRPLDTICATGLHLFFTLGLEITAIVLAVVHPDSKYKCQSYFIVLYLHIALWFITLIFDNFVRYKHHELRMNGYLDFYKQIYNYHRLPLYVISLWNTTLLFLQTIMQHVYPENFAEYCLNNGLATPLNALCAMITLEVCVLSAISTTYIVKVKEFNTQRPSPDVQKEEWVACSASEGFAQGEIGYMAHRDHVNDFIEKQADLIRYLKEHNNRLSEKVMFLNAQLKTRQQNT